MAGIDRILFVALAAAGWAGAAEFRAGVAQADLDPPPGVAMVGYNTRYAKGKLDPIEGRVLAISDGTRSLALVTLDLCFTFDPAVMDEIRAGARGAVDEVVFHASHTHSAPSPAAPEAVERAVPRLIAAIREAARAMAPARIGNGWGQVYLGFNRRYLMPDGSVHMFWRNETKIPTTFPVDPTVGVIRVDRSDGRPLAILVNYACHPVVLGPENLDYSADYPGEMRRAIERQVGGGVMAFFLQGAPGDINPYYDKTTLLEDAIGAMQETGRKLGAEAVRVARTITARAPANPRIQTKTVTVTAANRWNLPKLKALLQEKYHLEGSRAARLLQEKMELPVTTVLLNQDLAFVGMPGEPFVEFQMQLRARSPLAGSFLLGYTNGYFAYFPTIASAVRGGYGASSTVNPTEVGTGERMLNTGLVSIYELLGKLSGEPGRPRAQ
jgi:neutral ceramidase